MKRNYPIDALNPVFDRDLIRKIVFHEAGHAAAIHFYNKQKNLPPVFFEITIKQADNTPKSPFASRTDNHGHFVAIVEGGCLIDSLPISLIESANYYSDGVQDTYQTAFEADMVNLLVGPLAEAKHCALRDKKPFNGEQVYANTLHNYGGKSDLEKVYAYLGNFIADNKRHEQILSGLFRQAFEFVDSATHWQAIERLADYIMGQPKDTIGSEEAIAVLEGQGHTSAKA